MAVVFKVLCPVASFDVFNHMGFKELPEQLLSLVARYLGPKVVVASEQLMKVINRLRTSESAVVAAKVRPVPP